MKLKGIELNGTYKVRYFATCFAVYDEKGNLIYFEDSNGFWSKREYDENDNVFYYENSDGEIIDDRVKELTIEEIEKLLGYKIKIKGNESIDKNTGQEDAVFYGAIRGSEKADDILFALQVVYGEPKYTYSDFQKMNLSQAEINEALAYVKKKDYNKFSYFE